MYKRLFGEVCKIRHYFLPYSVAVIFILKLVTLESYKMLVISLPLQKQRNLMKRDQQRSKKSLQFAFLVSVSVQGSLRGVARGKIAYRGGEFMPFVCVTCGEHKFETCRPSLNFESTRQYMLAFERTEKLTLCYDKKTDKRNDIKEL